MKQEIEILKANAAPIQVALRSVLARENCLKLLEKHSSKMTEEGIPEEKAEQESDPVAKVMATTK